MDKKLTLKETKTSFILEIPKALFRKSGLDVTTNCILDLVTRGRQEYKAGKAKTFNSIKDLLFRQNPFDPSLKTHKLKGKLKSLYSYSINYSYRVLFEFTADDTALYFDVGTHEIYK